MYKKLEFSVDTKIENIIEDLILEIESYEGSLNSIIISSTSKSSLKIEDFSFLEEMSIDVIYHNDILNDNKDFILITLVSNPQFNIAIDGPSGSGKSTIAKKLAEILNIDYMDTGAMYRGITFALLRENINLEDEKEVCKAIENIDLSLINKRLHCNKEDVEEYIRNQSVTKNVSTVAQYPCVRDKLVFLQRKIASENSCVVDGRDISTVVLSDAKYKYFLTADASVRARRRYNEMEENISYDEVLKDILRRDEFDKNRKHSPLKKAIDAIEIDSTNLSIQEVVETILMQMRKKHER